MKILSISSKPFFKFPCVLVDEHQKSPKFSTLPLFHGIVDTLPSPLEGLLITSDLQAYTQIEPFQQKLFGIHFAEQFAFLANGKRLPLAKDIGVLLAGDLYAVPELNQRGGAGDVEDVWYAFSKAFRWVLGVAGNHDLFEGEASFKKIEPHRKNIYPLHGTLIEKDQIRFAGISGIRGKPTKPWRYTTEEFQKWFQYLIGLEPEIFILHEGPEVEKEQFLSDPDFFKKIKKLEKAPLFICGHHHWSLPLKTFASKVQFLNVDFRAILFTASSSEWGCLEKNFS